MALTAAERLAYVQTARDNAITALATATGTAIMVKYTQDPDGGQVTFASRKELMDYISDLGSMEMALQAEVDAEDLGITEQNAIPIVRRRQ